MAGTWFGHSQFALFNVNNSLYKAGLIIKYCNISDTTLTGGAKQNLPSLSKLVKIVEEEDKVCILYECWYSNFKYLVLKLSISLC